ncbi:aminotransferase DegT [Nonlabens sp. YIK11]|uniref:DegT/DnrJ/EryC1/StrS family aminotransferase n=1 Tax=Nonlabens sp. YIK11 TaxID=1453349 RepID=UPI0006DCC1AA|nr:DegT/DnrJ/EryC1/StrS family aminotransferase [Nonlabens sp. YIK11]KQC34073.1 aminotransferase DegT [Nonlabens sp. YIK11]
MIPVTKPFMPEKSDFEAYLDGIWKREWLTNNGPLVNELELKLKDFLGLKHMLYVTNGTIALQLAIKALDLDGEIITTPFSYVATTSSIVWENCTPIFADIDPNSLNINPVEIEKCITDKTTAILATHVYGNPCEIEKIDAIAKKYNLKVIYDAAHCFGTTYNGKSVFEYGDISTTSFHATKLFHTIEGGAVFTTDPELLKKLSYMRNFGHNGPESFVGLGINGKNSEFHAAMGLVNIKWIDSILENRKTQSEYYSKKLINSRIHFPKISKQSGFNYAYYPIVLESEEMCMKIFKSLTKHEIFPRRYFYPSLSTALSYVESKHLEISDDISKRVLCLPLYYDLSFVEIDMITRLILRELNN